MDKLKKMKTFAWIGDWAT